MSAFRQRWSQKMWYVLEVIRKLYNNKNFQNNSFFVFIVLVAVSGIYFA